MSRISGEPVALFTLLVVIPFTDRNPYRTWRKRPIAMTAMIAVVVAIVCLSLITGLGSTAQHL